MSNTRTIVACLLLLGSIVSAAGADPWDRINAAREAAGRGDGAGAIEAYRSAIDEDASVRDTIAVAYASQLTWAERYGEAIAEFNWYLERHPGATDARKTLALAQS